MFHPKLCQALTGCSLNRTRHPGSLPSWSSAGLVSAHVMWGKWGGGHPHTVTQWCSTELQSLAFCAALGLAVNGKGVAGSLFHRAACSWPRERVKAGL